MTYFGIRIRYIWSKNIEKEQRDPRLNYFIPIQMNKEQTGSLPDQPAEVMDELEMDSNTHAPKTQKCKEALR